MAAVNPIDQLKATATGGPIAGNEYAAQQKGVSDLRQQALTQASNDSNFVQAPAAFRAAQQQRLAVPLDAAIGQLGSQSAAAGQLSGALNSAQGQYLSSVQSDVPLIQKQMQYQAENPVSGYVQDAANKVYTITNRARIIADRQKKESSAANKQLALNDAVANNVSPDTHDLLSDVTKSADDLPSAVAALRSKLNGLTPVKYKVGPDGQLATDKDGAPVEDPNGTQYYTDSKGAIYDYDTNTINSYLAAIYGNSGAENLGAGAPGYLQAASVAGGNDVAALSSPPTSPAATAPSPAQSPSSFMAPGKVSGLVAPGNLDLTKRPVVKNGDGSISTVRSITITDGNGRAILIPTVVGGKVVSDEEAIKHYQQTGEHLGMFDSENDADAYAQTLHESQASMYGAQ